MKSFVDNALDNTKSKRRAFFGAVSNAGQVHAATGINMAGWKRKMASDEVRKTIERHGNPATEARLSPPQVAVTRDDFKRIRSIVEHPDIVTKEHLTGSRQLQAVGYQKTIGKVRYHVIEELQPKRKGASFLTMWKVQL
jgi:hypothetical protein